MKPCTHSFLTLPAALAVLAFAGSAAGDAVQVLAQSRSERLAEVSGLVASQRHADVFWAINDSGNEASLLAVGPDARLITELPVRAINRDWEDLALYDGQLYIADIGNNLANPIGPRIYVLAEPDPAARTTRPLPARRVIELQYADAPFDCEALIVTGGHGYLISKNRDTRPARLYRFDLDAPREQPTRIVDLGPLPVRSPVTSACLSPDGKQLAVLTVLGPRFIDLDHTGIESALNATESRGITYIDLTMESITWTDAGLFAMNETGALVKFDPAHAR